MFWIPLAIGAAAGIAKGEQDKKRAARQRNVEAATAAYSPWTGMKPNAVQEGPSSLESGLQGASTGAALGQGMESAENAGALNKSQIEVNTATANAYNRGGMPKTMIASAPPPMPLQAPPAQLGQTLPPMESMLEPPDNYDYAGAGEEQPPQRPTKYWGGRYEQPRGDGYYLVGGRGRKP